jgi:hypothetical protein
MAAAYGRNDMLALYNSRRYPLVRKNANEDPMTLPSTSPLPPNCSRRAASPSLALSSFGAAEIRYIIEQPASWHRLDLDIDGRFEARPFRR